MPYFSLKPSSGTDQGGPQEQGNSKGQADGTRPGMEDTLVTHLFITLAGSRGQHTVCALCCINKSISVWILGDCSVKGRQ